MSQMVSSIVRYDISTGNVQEMVPWMLAVNKAVNESAIPNSLLRSGSKIMHGERRGIQVNQHNTNPVKTKKNTSTIPAVTAEGDALEHNMIATASSKLSTIHDYLILKMLDLMEHDMIATASSKLSTIHDYLILKTLDLMLASVDSKLKEYCKQLSIFIYWQQSRYKNRQLPPQEDHGDQVRVGRRNVSVDFRAVTTSQTIFLDANHHPDRNDRKDRHQAAMLRTGKERGVHMRTEPDNQYAGKAAAENTRKTDVAGTTFRRGQVSTSSRTGWENSPVYKPPVSPTDDELELIRYVFHVYGIWTPELQAYTMDTSDGAIFRKRHELPDEYASFLRRMAGFGSEHKAACVRITTMKIPSQPQARATYDPVIGSDDEVRKLQAVTEPSEDLYIVEPLPPSPPPTTGPKTRRRALLDAIVYPTPITDNPPGSAPSSPMTSGRRVSRRQSTARP